MKRADNLFEQITDLENLKLAYLKALKGKRLPQNLSKLRRVQPWQLIFDNGNWNLHALDVVKNGCRRYTLSDIKNLKLTKEVFTLPKNYD